MEVEPNGVSSFLENISFMHPNRKFAILAGTLQAVIVVLFAATVQYDSDVDAKGNIAGDRTIGSRYPFFQDVHVMIFIGFGFLMTFLQKHGFSAVGYNFMIATFVIEWSILCHGFWKGIYDEKFHNIRLNIEQMILADFSAGAVLITFGAVLGRVNALQLLIIAFFEVIFYSLNEMVLVSEFVVADIGGSMVIHTFGAYFGLACSIGLGSSVIRSTHPNGHPANSSNKTSDTFAMIGTLFLWLYWPSFNGALANFGSQQHRTVINTILSLSASCMAGFICSALLRKESPHKFNMVDIQNATIAGGVAVGATADLVLEPYGALIVGSLGGIISVCGYVFLSPFLLSKIHLYDTCGVHNLHGMPGVLGALAAVVVTASSKGYDDTAIAQLFPERLNGRSAGDQAGYQFAGLMVTLLISIVGGLITGWIAGRKIVGGPREFYSDEEYWHVEKEEEEPERLLLNPGRARTPRVGPEGTLSPQQTANSSSLRPIAVMTPQ